MIDSKGLLMIEPEGLKTLEPVIDGLTRRVTAAWRRRTESDYGYRGFHMCICGAVSDNKDHWVGPNRLLTSALCIHYIALHRDEISPEELEKVRQLPDDEEVPTVQELRIPRSTVEPRSEQKPRLGVLPPSNISN